MDEPRQPELRASDRDRERTAEHLRRAAGDGQLTMEELDERLHAAHTSRTRGDLERITADLQPVEDTGMAPAPAPAPGGFAVRRGEGGARWLLAILGGCERKGRWRLATQATCVNIMGGSELDLNQVELAGDHVELTVVSIMGGAEIRVPNGLRVEVSELALMGGNSIDITEDRPSAAGPVLHLRLFSLMGGTDVRRGPKLSRAERRALKEQRRGLEEHRRGHLAGGLHPPSGGPPPPTPPRGPRP